MATCGYHYPCPDGAYAALAAFRSGRCSTFVPLPVFESEQSRIDAIPARFAAGSTVYLVDFSGGPRFILALCKHASRVVLVDHHKTAKEDVASFADETPSNFELVFDLERSGASLARDYFGIAEQGAVGSVGSEVLSAFAYIEDNDLWRHKLPLSREFAAGFASLKLEYDVNANPALWSTLLSLSVPDVIAAGSAALEAETRKVASEVGRAFPIEFPCPAGGQVFLAVVTDAPELRSPMGNLLATRSAEAGLLPVGAVVYVEPGLAESETLYKVSLRSLKEPLDYDTTALSREFGGGGHRNASSCNVPRAVFETWRRPVQ